MKIIKTKFKDLIVVKQKNNIDKRGSLREIYNKQVLKKNNFVFEYCTISKKNSLRGFHFQYKFQQAKYVSVLKGKILDCVIDLRKKSKTFGKSFKIILSEKNNTSVYIPPGFAHGFCCLDNENYVIYSCTNYRDKNSEKGIIFNDKDLRINWPIKRPIISTKDKNNLTLKQFLK